MTADGEDGAWTHVLTGSPWPERKGLRCRLVDDPGTGVYPFDKPHRTSAVILIENDPLTSGRDWWTCVVDGADLTPIGGPDA